MRLDFSLHARREPPQVWLFLGLMAFASTAIGQSSVNPEHRSARAAQDLAHPERKPTLPVQLEYTSPIGAYQAYKDQPVQPWREANDHVGRIGGWRTYAKEAQAAEPDASAPNDPHAGHHGGSQP